LPGTTREYTITIASVGQWVYLNPKIKLMPNVDADALNPGALVSITRDSTLWVFPTTWVIIFVILAIVYFVIRSRIKNRQRQVKQWLAYAEAEAKRKASNG
jgi:lipoprotein signal peptidase